MAKPVVFVIGATGNVGSATLQALSAMATNTLIFPSADRLTWPHGEKQSFLQTGYPKW